MKNKYTVDDIATWLLSKKPMTPKKLQKMLYYEYAWFLVFNNDNAKEIRNRLFDNNFEAWVHGPVDHNIYRKYSEYGYNEINLSKGEKIKSFDPDTLDSLEQVFETYSVFNGNELERLTHNELPWKMARGSVLPLDKSNEKISDESMFNYYSSLSKI